jgi:hypothetical protein
VKPSILRDRSIKAGFSRQPDRKPNFATAVLIRAASAARSTGTPSSLANIARIRSSGRGRLPV